MICKPCRNAGNELSSDCPDMFAVLDQYAQCKGGTWCDRNPEFPETLNA